MKKCSVECRQSRSPGLLTDNTVPLGRGVGKQLLLKVDDPGFCDGSEIAVNINLAVDAAHIDDALNGLDLRSGTALGELLETHGHGFLGSFGFLRLSHGSRGRSGGSASGLIVKRMTVADDGAVATSVGVLFDLVARVTLNSNDLRGSDLDNDTGMVCTRTAGIAEEDLIAHLGVLIKSAFGLVVLHGECASRTAVPGLALDPLTLGRTVGFEEAPVDKDVTPCKAVLVAVVILRGIQISRVLRPVREETVVLHHIICRDTIDEDVMEALKRKEKVQNDLINAVKANLEVRK